MLSPFLLAFIFLNVIPLFMGIKKAFTSTSDLYKGIFGNFLQIFHDYRFSHAVQNTLSYLVIALPLLIIFVLTVSLLLDAYPKKWHSYLRLGYLLPGSYVGAAGILVWYATTEPIIGPFRSIWHFFGINSNTQIFQPKFLPLVFAIIAIVANAGGWIVVICSSLNDISPEILEASQIDGCSKFQSALKIKLPMIQKNIIYMLVLAFSSALQLFSEPYIINESILRGLTSNWSLNQFSYNLAFGEGNFSGALAVSVLVLSISLTAAFYLIFKTRFFDMGNFNEKEK